MIYKILESGFIYDLAQSLIGADAVRNYFIENYLPHHPGQKILDIACGPGSFVPYLARLPNIDYIGVDVNPGYIERAKKRYPDFGNFLCYSISKPVNFGTCEFDVAIGLGILHHLSDEETIPLFKLAYESLKPGGRFITMDTCYKNGQNFIAHWLNRLDRGKYVRTLDEYEKLARNIFPTVHTFDYCGKLRLPSNQTVLICEKPLSQ